MEANNELDSTNNETCTSVQKVGDDSIQDGDDNIKEVENNANKTTTVQEIDDNTNVQEVFGDNTSVQKVRDDRNTNRATSVQEGDDGSSHELGENTKKPFTLQVHTQSYVIKTTVGICYAKV